MFLGEAACCTLLVVQKRQVILLDIIPCTIMLLVFSGNFRVEACQLRRLEDGISGHSVTIRNSLETFKMAIESGFLHSIAEEKLETRQSSRRGKVPEPGCVRRDRGIG